MIEVRNLSKRYGDHLAVDDLSFTVERGHIYGFLGPNGAGKSTTMNIITGCLAATDGSVSIDGHDIFEDPIEAKRHIGYLPEVPPLYLEMTPYEYLKFVARAKGVDKGEIEDQIALVMEETGITDMANRIIKNLSKGYRQRVGIAQAMLGSPEVIILDEPTVGLDPKQIIEIRELISSLGQTHTVILSSHILQEISAVCDYVLIIAHGRLVASDTLENLSTHYTGKSTVKVLCDADEGKLRMALSGVPDIDEYTIEPSKDEPQYNLVEITVPRDADIRRDVFCALRDAGCVILSLVTESLSLEDVFLRLTTQADEDYEQRRLAEANKTPDPFENDKAEPEEEDDDDSDEDEDDDDSGDSDGDDEKKEEEYHSLFTIEDDKKGDDKK